MTVCIAAICQANIIVGASDRMLTAGDVEFEPHFAKSIAVTNSIVVMMAGDSALQAEIVQEVYGVVIARIKKEPDRWWKVKEVAEMYAKFYAIIKKQRAETAILVPLGLMHETFINRQPEMSKDFVEQITKELLHFEMPYFETIVTGVDETGAHIFEVNNNTITCYDSVGFAAIGSGARHAQSQFILARHSRIAAQDQTLFLAYSSKKLSEAAPGVGKETDMFSLGPELGSYFVVQPAIMKELDKIHKARMRREQATFKRSMKEVGQYVQRLQKEVSELSKEQQNPQPDPGLASPDGGGVPVDPKKS